LFFRKVVSIGKSRLYSPHKCRLGRISSLKSLIFIGFWVVFVPYAFGQAVADHQSSAKPQSPLKVAILPVTIHSPEDLSYMKEGILDMLSSRVELSGRVVVLEKGAVKKALAGTSGEMDSAGARNLGRALGADFVVFGSLTKLGDSASLDLKVVEVNGENPAASVYIQAKKTEEVIARVDELARRVDEKVLGYPLTPPAAEKPAEASKQAALIPAPLAIPTSPAAGKPVEAPRQAAITPVPPVPPTSSQTLSPAPPARGAISSERWRSQAVPFKVVGIDIGDLDGDGRNEVALIGERKLWIYRWEGELKVIKKIEGEKFDRYLAIDVVDTKKNGRAEIFVTNIQQQGGGYVGQSGSPNRLSSFVVAYIDGDFKVVSSGLDWFFRAVDWGDKGRILFGQRKMPDEGFSGPIYEIGWDGKMYKDMRKANIPKGINLYGFTPFSHDGKTDFAYIDSDFKLKMMDEKGKVVWRSREDYASDNRFQFKVQNLWGNLPDEFASVNVRVIAKGEDLFIIHNVSAIGEIFARSKYYSKGEVKRLAWTGATFVETWRSQEISGYLADFQLQERKEDRTKELFVAVAEPTAGILSTDSSSALMVSPLPAVQ
jgi:TolB-like protein